jgi:hypothetical protein
MRVRDAIRDLPASRIAEIAALGMGDPAVIPLWYGEGDFDPRLHRRRGEHSLACRAYPTGWVIPAEEIAVLLGFARRHGCFARDPAQIGDAVERLRPILD